MPKNPYYDAKKNSKGWLLVSLHVHDYDMEIVSVFKRAYEWCRQNNLKLMTDFNCREVEGKNARFDFWFKDRSHALMFSHFASDNFVTSVRDDFLTASPHNFPAYLGRINPMLAMYNYNGYAAKKVKDGWVKVSLPTDLMVSETFYICELIDWCKTSGMVLTEDYDHRAAVDISGVAIDFWFRDKQKAMLFKLTFV